MNDRARRPFHVGDRVRPRPEHRGPGSSFPRGVVRAVHGMQPKGYVLYLDGHKKPFLSGYYEHDEAAR